MTKILKIAWREYKATVKTKGFIIGLALAPILPGEIGVPGRPARSEQLLKRPGDIPEFLRRIEEGKRNYKRRLFDNSLKLIFGKV